MADVAEQKVIAMESDFPRSESDLLVFISSVMSDELNHARHVTEQAVRAVPPITRPWAFESTPASSESPTDGYLRKVEEADFVIWLIGRETTQPVVNEINTCISAGRRLLAFKLPSEARDASTRNLIDRASGYAKWKEVDDIAKLPGHVNAALSDEFVRGIRDPSSPARVHKLREQRQLSVSRCKWMWIALGVPDGIAAVLSQDQSIGDMLRWPGQGLHMVVGDQGAGKTLALERLFQRLVKRALDDSSQPFPLFVSARDLREPLIEYVERMSEGYSRPPVQGTSILIDGLDEIGVTEANTLLEQAAAYTDANSKATAIVATRKLPGLKCTGQRFEMPTMDDEYVISLISRISGRELDMHVRHAWSDSAWEASKRPLFAVMIGAELRKNPGFAVPRPSQLVNHLAEGVWQEAGDNAEVVDELLQKLAVKAIGTGTRARLADITPRRARQRILTDSRLVNEQAGTVDFTIPIFREWYAARALIEHTVSVEDILPASDRWIIPLAIAIDSEDEELGRCLMVRIASSDPGLASLLLKEFGERRHGDGTDELSLGTAVEVGEEIRNAMEAWGRGLGELYPVIGPVGRDGNTATLGIQLHDRRITKAWYAGTEELSPVVDLPDINWRRPHPDWRGWSYSGVPRTRVWPWVMTQRALRDSLKDKIKSKQLALGSADAVRELSWAFVLALKRLRELNAETVYVHDVLRHIIGYIDDNLVGATLVNIGGNSFLDEELRTIERHLSASVVGGEDVITDPWPSADQLNSSGWVWGDYSEQRLLERTNAVYAGALRIYEKMVEKWFRPFNHRLRLSRLLPARLEGRLAMPSKQDADTLTATPVLAWHTRSLPADAESTVAFELGPREDSRDDFEQYWREEENALRALRPGYGIVLYPIRQWTVLDIFDSRPATELAHRWLTGELRELDWAGL